MRTNEELYEEALEATNRLFSDRQVSQGRTAERLRDLRDEIKIMLDTLTED